MHKTQNTLSQAIQVQSVEMLNLHLATVIDQQLHFAEAG